MTDLDLGQIEARANAATPGPWDVGPYGTSFTSRHVGRIILAPMIAPASFDAEFIAHAREDVPALVAEVRRARGVADAALAELDRSLEARDRRAERERDAARAEAERLRAERNIAVNAVASRSPDFDVRALAIASRQRDEANRNAAHWKALLGETRTELSRTEGDLAVAVAEAARVREALGEMAETLERITTERNAFRDERNEAREALQAVREFVGWLTAMGQPTHEALETRRVVTLSDTISRARAALRALDAALDGAE